MHYLVPDTGDTSRISELTSRTKIPLHHPKNIRDYILMTQTDPIAIIAVAEDLMLLLSRHASSIFPDELPVVLHSVPGLIYQGVWASMATAFPPAHFRDFEEATKRSGVLSTSSAELESRGMGAMVLDVGGRSSMSDEQTLDDEDLADDSTDH